MRQFRTLKEHVYVYISDQIFLGKLKSGEKINESEISEALSVSRTPVREALIQLSCEGVLDNIPRRGFVLRGTSEKEATELYQVIGALDALSARCSYKILTDREYAVMERHIQSMYFAINTDDYGLYLQHQDAFHSVYLDACQNDILSETIKRLKNRFFTRGYDNIPDKDRKEYLRGVNAEHEEILRLFREKRIDELSSYIISTHWGPSNARVEMF